MAVTLKFHSLAGSKRKAIDGSTSGSVTPSSSAVPVNVAMASDGTNRSAGIDNGTQGQMQQDASGAQTQTQGALGTQDILAIDDDEEEDVEEEEANGSGKRKKRCTSAVWKFFTERTLVVEVDGKKYEQLWGHCNFPKCKQKYRAESNYGTNAFRNHLKSQHKQVKGQLQLKAEKDNGKDVTAIVPYRYDYETSLKKLYLAVIMHEYPFNIVEHDYFVQFIKSLRPSFTFKIGQAINSSNHISQVPSLWDIMASRISSLG
jgi:hypothetical protein